jgi:SAM-dependent MidA family methyltransferase
MDAALYTPGLGYYTSPETDIGKDGDFYTSPHLHPVFGAMLGVQMEEMWEFMGRPVDFSIVETGAGRGFLALDMLGYLKGREIFDALRYMIIEINPHMKERQKALLSAFGDKAAWPETLGDLKNQKGCILANELIDSLPVHLIRMEDELKEIYVTAEGDELKEAPGPLSNKEISDYISEFCPRFPEGYRTEVNLRAKRWLKDAAGALSEGFIVTIDYGYPAWDYYSEERSSGTLLCYFRHETDENPYENVGRKDITAHVNFSALKKWAEEEKIMTIGFCPQGTYLVSLGIDKLIDGLYGNSKDYLFEVAKIKGLLFPGTMGETHKVMAFYKGSGRPQLRGFSLRNQIKNL